ncbi:MAG: HAD family phosphatase [Clostridia bacterium]|nr:HAD family phosphatase [Clostridia bacterium]
MREKMPDEPMNGVRAVCFDLFFTLADPQCDLEHTESDPLGVSPEEWGKACWGEPLGTERGLGLVKTDRELIRRACECLGRPVTEEQMEQARLAKNARMRKAVTDIAPEITETVRILRERGYRTGLISNADVSDRMHWDESPLAPYFDDVIFSCDVGILKPDPAIYLLSLKHLGVRPEEAVFVGDGGSSEHKGAKKVGMNTVCVQHLISYTGKNGTKIRRYADRVTNTFPDLLRILPGKE